MTSQPTNESELQLYRVLQRANLLAYYDTFICQGGDDVQQLCEAGEEEFLEIMALVGMASKPLHVRRLQKSLQEWVSNPVAFLATAMFQGPPPVYPPPPPPSAPSGPLPPGMTAAAAAALMSAAENQRPIHHHPAHHPRQSPTANNSLQSGPPPHSARDMMTSDRCPSQRRSPVSLMGQAFPGNNPPSSSRRVSSPAPLPGNLSSASAGTASSRSSPSPTLGKEPRNCSGTSGGSGGSSGIAGNGACSSDISQIVLSIAQHQAQGNFTCNMREGLITNEYGQPASPISLTPVLLDSQIQRLSDAAEALVKSLPAMDPKLATNKKRISKELEHVMNMSDHDSRRLDEIRKYAAIYGRFDCKRKPEKPLTLHEVSVNEAAAQICKHIPALLTRRDELFPLARQVVRDSGYQYSKGHSRSQMGVKRPYDESGNAGNSNCSNSKYFHSSGSNDAKDTDDTEDSQYSLYSSSDPGDSPAGDQGSSNSQDDRDTETRNGELVRNGTESGSSPVPNENGSCELQSVGSNNPENFSKLLPAKKSGNFGSASQLAKQLVQETLLDEGLKVVKEFNSDHRSRTPVEATAGISNDESPMSLTSSATPTTSSTESSPIKSDPITSIMGTRHQSPQILSHFMSQQQQHHVTAPRPRGRPPKAQVMADRLEAAYQEKLTQHIQQTFLATHAYNQALAVAANGYANRSMNGNGHGLEQIIVPQGKETHENLNNGRGNGQYGPFESVDDSSPKDMVMRVVASATTVKNGTSPNSNGTDSDLIADLTVKQGPQQPNGRDCGILDATDS